MRSKLLLLLLFVSLLVVGCGGDDPEPPPPPPPPTDGGLALSDIPDQTGLPGVATEVSFTITAETPEAVTLTASSSDQAVIADAGLSLSGEGESRTLSITPSEDSLGSSAEITVSAETDDESADTSFTFTVGEGEEPEGPGPSTGTPFGGTPAVVSSAELDGFGSAIAIQGDYALVGAPLANEGTGAVLVFTRDGDTWTQLTQLTAADGAAGDRFGAAITMDDNYAIVGAPEADVAADPDVLVNAGAAYVFQLISGAWTETDKISPFGGNAGAQDRFGFSVAASGDFVVIGAYEDDNTGTDSGSVFVFERDYSRNVNGTLWTERTNFRPADNAAGNRFGISVALSDTTAVIGASDADGGVNAVDAGAVYVFERGDAGNVWTESAKLTPSDAGNGDRFGRDVAVSGDYAIIGAYLDDNNGDESGSAYVYRRGEEGWENVSQLAPDDGAAGDLFGRGVAMTDQYALISAYSSDSVQGNAGAVYAFELSDETWSLAEKITVPSALEGARFGFSVALSDSNAAVGAFNGDSEAASTNSAYIYGQ